MPHRHHDRELRRIERKAEREAWADFHRVVGTHRLRDTLRRLEMQKKDARRLYRMAGEPLGPGDFALSAWLSWGRAARTN